MFDIDDLREHADASIEEGRRVIADARRRIKPGLDTARASAEPYLARATAAARHQTGPGFDQAQAWLDAARKDPRVVRAAEGAETVAALVVGAVSEYVVKPAMAYGQEHGSRMPGHEAPTDTGRHDAASGSEPVERPDGTAVAGDADDTGKID